MDTDVGIIATAALSVVFYFYISHLENRIDALESKIALLESAISC